LKDGKDVIGSEPSIARFLEQSNTECIEISRHRRVNEARRPTDLYPVTRSSSRHQTTRQNFVEQHPDRKPITQRTSWLSSSLFWRHVSRRPDKHGLAFAAEVLHCSRGELLSRVADEPHVENDDSLWIGHEDISRLEISMDATGRVELPKAHRELSQNGATSCKLVVGAKRDALVRATKKMQNTSANQQLHDQQPSLVGKQQFVQSDKVRMVNAGDEAKFAFEAVNPQRVVSGQLFDGDQFVSLTVKCLVDDSHRASSDLATDRETVRLKHTRGPTIRGALPIEPSFQIVVGRRPPDEFNPGDAVEDFAFSVGERLMGWSLGK